MTNFKNYMLECADIAQKSADELLPIENKEYDIVTEAMRYSLLSGGKRIRACLVMWVYEQLGGKKEDVLPFAAAIEMVHAYSLIHDDLPCMDDDDFRRGNPSCHIKYGQAVAVLAGDALLTHAFTVMLTEGVNEKISPQKALKAAGVLALCAGHKGMVGGQIMDLQNEGKSVELAAIEKTNNLKTGKLILAACQMGAILGGADESFMKNIEIYAEKIGVAFQVADDILDATGDAKKLGKPTGSDESNHKSTYVSLLGTKKANMFALELAENAKQALEAIGIEEGSALHNLADMMVNRDH